MEGVSIQILTYYNKLKIIIKISFINLQRTAAQWPRAKYRKYIFILNFENLLLINFVIFNSNQNSYITSCQ